MISLKTLTPYPRGGVGGGIKTTYLRMKTRLPDVENGPEDTGGKGKLG